jgi:hypothetical protein
MGGGCAEKRSSDIVNIFPLVSFCGRKKRKGIC